eukprot:12735492-Alexandrium_andersonii.AAC.1
MEARSNASFGETENRNTGRQNAGKPENKETGQPTNQNSGRRSNGERQSTGTPERWAARNV